MKKFSLPLAGKYGKLMKRSTHWRHQANEGKSGLEAETVRAHGTLHSLRSKQMLAVER